MLYDDFANSNQLLPLMVQFKRPLQSINKIYSYDNCLDLNMVLIKGENYPAVLLSECEALLKTKGDTGGED